MQQNQHQQLDYNSSPPPSYNEVANGKSQDGSMPEEDAQTMIKAVVMILLSCVSVPDCQICYNDRRANFWSMSSTLVLLGTLLRTI